ncbi:uncharacterized protein LOC108136294 isoform X6 [Drosophila elegans]|uniref:uncharacterized protein LOC108136294 isoform X6 n=1 Tax=Drosophila elegans TaxID=30023 RepID=UPI001BC84932|nr:uncharacterized protein LOC108136294 isoform X6 [Drosophila elegans]
MASADEKHREEKHPRDRFERLEFLKETVYTNGESKIQEDYKHKRDSRNDRSLPKNIPQIEPVLQSSNKYSGLDDEGSE